MGANWAEFNAAIANALKEAGVDTDEVPGPGVTEYTDKDGDTVRVWRSA